MTGLTYGGSFNNQRFSQLQQVTTENVHQLRVKWTFPIPDAGADNSLQTTALVIRGKDAGLSKIDALMFVTSPMSRVVALDAATGTPIWDFAPPQREPINVCCSRSNRGVAFGRLGPSRRAKSRVRLTTWMHAFGSLDAATGSPVSSFGDGAGPPGRSPSNNMPSQPHDGSAVHPQNPDPFGRGDSTMGTS
jgi:glucose dehydrogenase